MLNRDLYISFEKLACKIFCQVNLGVGSIRDFMIRSVTTYIYQCMDATKDFDSCN